MPLTAKDALDILLSQKHQRLERMPDGIGLYGLGDHEGRLHYFGKTDSDSFRDRIWSRHISGSEDRSHKLACNYAVGRMWHDRKHPGTNASDGAVSRRVRQAFIRRYCGFVCLPLTLSSIDLRALERAVIDLAGPQLADWNGSRRRVATFDEPIELVDDVIHTLGLSDGEIAAIDRQDAIFRSI